MSKVSLGERFWCEGKIRRVRGLIIEDGWRGGGGVDFIFRISLIGGEDVRRYRHGRGVLE